MRAERVVGLDRDRHQVGARWLHARVHVLPEVAVRPAVESAVANRGHVIGNEIAAELVALVDGDPQRSGARLPRHPDGIAEPTRENAMRAAREIHLPDRGASYLVLHSVIARVAVGA